MDNNYNNFDPFGTENQNIQDAEDNKTQFEKQSGNYNNQTPNTYSPQSGYYYPIKNTKPHKKKKRFSSAALVACSLICAIVASASSSYVVLKLLNDDKVDSNGSQSSQTIINVDKNATGAVSAIAKKAVPSVVGITVTMSVDTYFGQQMAKGEGSGVIYSKDGYIITNYHVISDSNSGVADNISVFLSNDSNNAIKAKVIGYDSDYDLAVIKIDKTGLTPIDFTDSNNVAVGDMAVAIGNPGGQQFMSSVSSGVISGLNRTVQLEGTAEMKLLQTDAAINPGNSGGALVDCYGKLVGINSSKISDTDFEGMGFAIPSNTVKKIVSNIINNKDKKYAYLGVKISTDYSADYLESIGYPAGAVVESVDEGSPAAKTGIKAYDIIVSFDGVKVKDYNDYNTERLKHKPGETVTIQVYRTGRTYNAKITLGESNN